MRWGFLLSGIVLGATSSLGAEGVRLRYKLTAGEVLRYRETVEGSGEFSNPSVSAEPVPLQLTGTMQREWRVEAVEKGPLFHIDSQVKAATLRGAMGQEQEETPYPRSHLGLEMTDRGYIARVRSRLTPGQTADPLTLLGFPLDLNALFHGFLTVGLPEGLAEPGATWLEEEVPLPLENGSKARGRIHTRLRGMKAYQGHNCAEIDAGFELPVEARTRWQGVPVVVEGKMTGALTLHFAPERGVVVHALGLLLLEWTLTETPPRGSTPTEPVSVKMQLKLETNLDESPLQERQPQEIKKEPKL